MKIKKILAMIAAGTLTITMLAGCNIPVNIPLSGKDGETANVDLFGGNSGNEGSNVDEEKATATEAPIEISQSDSEFVNYSISSEYRAEWCDEFSVYASSVSDELITVDEKAAPKLAATLEKRNKEAVSKVEESAEECYNTAIQMIDDGLTEEDAKYYLPCKNNTRAFVRRSDKQIFSVGLYNISYLGGAHDYYMWYGETYNTQSGEKMRATDFIAKPEELAEVLEKEILENYNDTSFWSDLSEYFEETYLSGSDSNDFAYYVDYDGITIFFNPYEIASFADGVIMVTLRYEDYPELLNKEYFENAPKNYIVTLDKYLGYEGDIYGDKARETLYISANVNPEYDEIEEISIWLDGEETVSENYCFDYVPYIVKKNGNTYLYLELSTMNDYTYYVIYDLTSGTPVEVTAPGGGYFDSFVDPESFVITDRSYMLSTWGAMAHYRIGDDGAPELIDRDYLCDSEYFVLTLKQDIVCDEIDIDSHNKLGDINLKAGDEISIYSSNLEDYVVFKTKDGRYVKLNVTLTDDPDSWGYKVNGIGEYDLFDGQLYAG